VKFLYAVAGVVLGGLIAYCYSGQASKELRREADPLRRETEDARHYVHALISYLEAAGQISVRRDADGRPIQVQILRGGGDIASPRASSHAVPTLTYFARAAPGSRRRRGAQRQGARCPGRRSPMLESLCEYWQQAT
jgi:hypothetical protein